MDVSFALFYSLGGAIAMLFGEPLIWIPALVIGRNSPRRGRFWAELIVGLIVAFFIGWRENGFASMADIDATVKAVQLARPSLAELFAALLASLGWKTARSLVATYKARKSLNAAN